jgi:HSP20 family protein
MASHEWEILVWQRANSLMRQAERIQRNFAEVAVRSHYRGSQNGSSSWQPPVNILESDSSLAIVAALPGVKRESVKISLDGNVLIIAGERPLPASCTDGRLRMWEIPLGRFERRLKVADDQRPLTIAHYGLSDGLLTIELRKNL